MPWVGVRHGVAEPGPGGVLDHVHVAHGKRSIRWPDTRLDPPGTAQSVTAVRIPVIVTSDSGDRDHPVPGG